jgi:hypothetical protein
LAVFIFGVLAILPFEYDDYKDVSNAGHWCGQIITQLGTPRGRYDEHSSKFSLSKKPRFIEPVEKNQTSEGDAC